MSSYIREVLFINGDDGNAMANRINRQPLGIYCNVFDGKWRDYLKFCGTNHGGVDFGVPEYVAQWEEDMKHVVDAGAKGYVVRHGCLTERADMQQTPVYGAETPEELAEKIGVDPATFAETIANYNRYAETGVDEEWGKPTQYLWACDTAPYYALRVSSGMVNTNGGIRINRNAQVVDARFKPIVGLYAAGVCTSGWDNELYGGGS